MRLSGGAERECSQMEFYHRRRAPSALLLRLLTTGYGTKRRKAMSAPMSAIRWTSGLVLLNLSSSHSDPMKTLPVQTLPRSLTLMRILNEIANAWGWMGVRPRAIVMENTFGNVIFTDDDGQYWRVCPEELSCEVIAFDREEFARVQNSDSFLRDWTMRVLVEQVHSALGNLSAERCYCLKIPGALGGDYALHNIATIDRAELISVSGHIAQQIKDLPNGAKIKLNIID